jgi:hypothetical protein
MFRNAKVGHPRVCLMPTLHLSEFWLTYNLQVRCWCVFPLKRLAPHPILSASNRMALHMHFMQMSNLQIAQEMRWGTTECAVVQISLFSRRNWRAGGGRVMSAQMDRCDDNWWKRVGSNLTFDGDADLETATILRGSEAKCYSVFCVRFISRYRESES